MNNKSKLDRIDKNIDKLIQLQDLSTIQTALLAIIFGLFVFSITAITNRYNDLVYVVSFIMLFVELIILIGLLLSIFASDYGSKVEYFMFAVWFLILTVVYTLVSILYFVISLRLTSDFTVSNTVVVSLILIIIVLAISVDRIIRKKIKKRFSLLYKKDIIRPTGNKLLDAIDRILYKIIRSIAISLLIAILISIISGYVEISPNHYGFPFAWFIQNMNGTSFIIDATGLYLDFIVFTALTYAIIYVVKHFRNIKKIKKNHIHKKHPKKNLNEKKADVEKLDKDESNWEDHPAFVKYK